MQLQYFYTEPCQLRLEAWTHRQADLPEPRAGPVWCGLAGLQLSVMPVLEVWFCLALEVVGPGGGEAGRGADGASGLPNHSRDGGTLGKATRAQRGRGRLFPIGRHNCPLPVVVWHFFPPLIGWG